MKTLFKSCKAEQMITSCRNLNHINHFNLKSNSNQERYFKNFLKPLTKKKKRRRESNFTITKSFMITNYTYSKKNYAKVNLALSIFINKRMILTSKWSLKLLFLIINNQVMQQKKSGKIIIKSLKMLVRINYYTLLNVLVKHFFIMINLS